MKSLLVSALVLTLAAPVFAGQAALSTAPALTPAAMEAFLLNAKIVRTRDAGIGVTGSRRVTLSDGSLTHDAHVQVVDIHKTSFEAGPASEVNFRDTYRFNIAAYRLAALLGLRVPMSVQRNFEGGPASFTWWVDDVAMDESGRRKGNLGAAPEKTAKQLYVMRAFDELIQNRDRNSGNMLWTKDWTLWLIDHTRAFRLDKELRKTDDLIRIDRGTLASLRAMDPARVGQAIGGSLMRNELEAMLARRLALLQHFDQRIARTNEAVVLFNLDD